MVDYYHGHRQLPYKDIVMQNYRGTLKTHPIEFNDAVGAGGRGEVAGEQVDDIALRMQLATFTNMNQNLLRAHCIQLAMLGPNVKLGRVLALRRFSSAQSLTVDVIQLDDILREKPIAAPLAAAPAAARITGANQTRALLAASSLQISHKRAISSSSHRRASECRWGTDGFAAVDWHAGSIASSLSMWRHVA